MTHQSGRIAYRTGVGLALLVSFLQVWMNIVGGIAGEDDPVNQGFFGVVLTAAACAFVACFRAEGMARAMLATAVVQGILAVVIATAPSHADHAVRVLVLSAGFATVWLMSAAAFRRSARQGADLPAA